VPAAATGTIRVILDRVTIADNKGHGVLVNDQVHPETEDGVQPVADGSAASLRVEVTGSSFLRNGYSVSDRDGLRVNEGGEGSLTFVARLSRSEDNAADGIELDERGAGDVTIDVKGVTLARNGKFDPLDFDDGFDIDEYDDGSLLGTVTETSSVDNFEEGFDFNENNAGDFRVDMSLVNASGNAEEGIDYEEDDDFAGGGDLGDDDGGRRGERERRRRRAQDPGEGCRVAGGQRDRCRGEPERGERYRDTRGRGWQPHVDHRARETEGNAAHGIDFDENSTGDLVAAVSNSVSTGNTLFGSGRTSSCRARERCSLTRLTWQGIRAGRRRDRMWW
jgi:hypothetical protein